jgi:hypothetical protein
MSIISIEAGIIKLFLDAGARVCINESKRGVSNMRTTRATNAKNE